MINNSACPMCECMQRALLEVGREAHEVVRGARAERVLEHLLSAEKENVGDKIDSDYSV